VTDSRQYPERPIVGVGAVIVDEGNVLLVKRKYEPLKGQWSLPGGMVEIGETLETGAHARDARGDGIACRRWSCHRGVRPHHAR
jgi:8-oxo-dGTP pyrophosphatase MutT (NUDIX family)